MSPKHITQLTTDYSRVDRYGDRVKKVMLKNDTGMNKSPIGVEPQYTDFL